ncbi:hypothetical protein APSETT445_001678 [Aspergillus pseudonomiae]
MPILPAYQGTGVGNYLVKEYVEYIRNAEIEADRIVLICHDYLIRFYESAGFVNRGLSRCQFAGGGWVDMVFGSRYQKSGFYKLDILVRKSPRQKQGTSIYDAIFRIEQRPLSLVIVTIEANSYIAMLLEVVLSFKCYMSLWIAKLDVHYL